MKNQYMFFEKQFFENFNLSAYKKTDIGIPNTDIYIYEFECQESSTCNDDITKAKRLDELTKMLTDKYEDSFIVVNSESAQYFCGQIYPLIVIFETKLRYALYISRSLYNQGEVSKESYLLSVERKKKAIEEVDFGQIYEAVFTDSNLQEKVKGINGRKLTKSDLIKEVQALDENTLWRQMVGGGYNYIETHFFEIIKHRNDVMHNHLIGYKEYEQAKSIIQSAIDELEQVINDKLLDNNSKYLNDVNIVVALSNILKTMETISKQFGEVSYVEHAANVVRMLALARKNIFDRELWLNNDDTE